MLIKRENYEVQPFHLHVTHPFQVKLLLSAPCYKQAQPMFFPFAKQVEFHTCKSTSNQIINLQAAFMRLKIYDFR
jgi:hypothetical protein